MKCARCPTTGPVGSVIMMRRDGMVPGINIPRFIALCYGCTQTENDADEYQRAKGGETANTDSVAG